jgi:hypothetical protein
MQAVAVAGKIKELFSCVFRRGCEHREGASAQSAHYLNSKNHSVSTKHFNRTVFAYFSQCAVLSCG